MVDTTIEGHGWKIPTTPMNNIKRLSGDKDGDINIRYSKVGKWINIRVILYRDRSEGLSEQSYEKAQLVW